MQKDCATPLDEAYHGPQSSPPYDTAHLKSSETASSTQMTGSHQHVQHPQVHKTAQLNLIASLRVSTGVVDCGKPVRNPLRKP
eukprot:1162062-Pelagomonas_calceolata.AAC.25